MQTASLAEVHRSPNVADSALIPGAGQSSNMSGTFGQDVLRLTGFTEEDFERMALLSKITGPSEKPLTTESLDLLEKSLAGRLAALRRVKAECGSRLPEYLAMASSQQQAARPFLQFRTTLQQLKAHVCAVLKTNREAVSKFFNEGAELRDRFNLAALNETIAKWKKGSSELSEDEHRQLIDFVLWPANGNVGFEFEHVRKGIENAKREAHYIPALPVPGAEHREEQKLVRWLIGDVFDGMGDIPLQFFLHLSGVGFAQQCAAPCSALATLQAADQVKQQLQILHTKLGLATAFRQSPENDPWQSTIDDLKERVEACAVLAEAIGMEHSLDVQSIVGNFNLNSMKIGPYNVVQSVFPSESPEHWWPMAWLGFDNDEAVMAREAELREFCKGIPATEVQFRVSTLLERQASKAKIAVQWMDIVNWQ